MSIPNLQIGCATTDEPPLATGNACPPPLRCREVSALLDEQASAWELPAAECGTRGWCWGEGPPVYLLHPGVGSARLYALLAFLLRDECRCMLVDWQPVATRRRLDPYRFVDEFCRVIEAAGDTDVTVYAPGLGSALALRAAARRPELFGRIVLQNVTVRQRLSWWERRLAPWYRTSTRPLRSITGRETVQILNHRRWFPPLDPDRWQWFLDVTGELPLSWVVAQAELRDRLDLTHDLPQVRCPVLLLDVEGVGPRAAAAQADVRSRLPNARSVPVHTTGRQLYLTHPHRLQKLLLQFLHDPASFDMPSNEPEFFALKPT